jgi:uncharacterized iron-regulated protein
MRHSEPSTHRCVSFAGLFAATLTACSSAPLQPPPNARIYDVHAQRFVTEPALVADLAVARYRLLGEIHDDPAHHAIRARLLSEIAERGARPAVVMEQFDLDHDDALRAAQHAAGDAEQMATAGALDRKGWQWPLHEPIVAAALALRLPLRAGNLSRRVLGSDLDRLLEKNVALRARFHAARWTDVQARDLRADIVESHCGLLPDAVVPRLVVAQRMRDAAMAQALVDGATTDGAILIAGNEHVRADRGVPIYLHARGSPDAGARSVSVGFVEAGASEERAPDFPASAVTHYPGFDYLWFTPPVARDDPCQSRRAAPSD